MSARSLSGTMWLETAAATGTIQRSSGMRAARAAPAEVTTNATAWSTVQSLTSHLRYGVEIIRLPPSDPAIADASGASRRQAPGLTAAAAAPIAHSSPSAAVCSGGVRPARWASADSMSAYWWAGTPRPRSTSSRVMISLVGRSTSSGSPSPGASSPPRTDL